MKTVSQPPPVCNSIADLHKAFGIPKPLYPLISLVKFKGVVRTDVDIILKFYLIFLTKTNSAGIDAVEDLLCGLSFVSPNQSVNLSLLNIDLCHYTLCIHPNFIKGHSLEKKIGSYGYLSQRNYDVLHLSEKEKTTVLRTLDEIAHELLQSADHFSHEIIISYFEQLLNYGSRFYSRQHFDSKASKNEIVIRMEILLDDYYSSQKSIVMGLPSVDFMARELGVSRRYLSRITRESTGQNTQQYMQSILIGKAKELLVSTNLSVAEIAYRLGFEHPQSLNKIFKRKTNSSPINFRRISKPLTATIESPRS